MLLGIKAVLLVGGAGTRLRSVVSSVPKPLAPVGDRPFLELLVRQLHHQGIRRIVLCTGYRSEQIEREFRDGRDLGVEIRYSKEVNPLGTAGAVKLAGHHLADADDSFLVMNGDSFLEIDFHRLIRFHRENGGLVSMAVLRVPDASRYGTVQAASDGRVIGFMEKTGMAAPGLVNAGIYVFERSVLDEIPEPPSSLERDVFPRLLDRGIFAIEENGLFIDIGTPEDFARAQTLNSQLRTAAQKG